MNLLELANKYGTDKVGHSYIPVYEKFLPKYVNSLLEIGILKGASARMFDDYYNHRAGIYLIDLFQEEGNLTVKEATELGWIPIKGSQAIIETLNQLKEEVDFIVDDGSHVCFHQIFSFKHLFLNNLKSKGLYFIEDCHTSKDSFWYGEGVESFEDTPLWLFKNYIETGKIENKFFNEGESLVFENIIDSVHIECEEKLIIITKK